MANELTDLLQALLQSTSNPSGPGQGSSPALRDLLRAAAPMPNRDLAADAQSLARTAATSSGGPIATPRITASAEAEDTGISAGAVLRTAGMVTGVGPLVTGLLRLFGSGGDSEPPPPLVPYEAPGRISVEAGIGADRSFVPVSYGASGIARAGDSGAASASRVPAAQIQVNVNAMDSRSFLDHSDDIARAVRDAMLRSHSLNDVVSEI